jgi:hypothetical protein
MKLGVIAAVALCACFSAGATNLAQLPVLPDVPPAGSMLDGLDRTIYRCQQHADSVECRRPGGTADHVEGEPAIEIVLVYRQRVLVRSVVTFGEQHFNAIAGKLSVILGRAAREREALNAGMGGTFENQYYIWRRDGRVWLLEQFYQRITDSGLWMMNEAQFDALMSERERRKVRGVRNL